MTRGLIINTTANAIEMTKIFAGRASIYGTEEYMQLQGARKDYPSFKVITKKSIKCDDGFKGLTFGYMENYIKKNSSDSTLLSDFYALCGKDENGNESEELTEYASYGEIKQWFLAQYPEIKYAKKNQRDRINNILGKVA